MVKPRHDTEDTRSTQANPPLKDKNLFARVTLDEELQTIAWSNGADFAPKFLKSHLKNIR
ncbi:MAG: DUF2442 domain-containing protein [Rickettsia endosymbiont of Stiretrus anchorago]|nr:DUF2442 domain-containing protein [Rickettsia endosymbiont of Stiretrus anchorago]